VIMWCSGTFGNV